MTTLLAPTAVALVVDVSRRGAQLLELSPVDMVCYVLALIESVVVWGLLIYAATGSSRSAIACRVLFVLGLTLCLGGQVYFFEQFRAYLTRDLTLFASNLTQSALSQLWSDGANYSWTLLPFALSSGAILWCARRSLNGAGVHQQRAARWAPVVFVACWFVPNHYRTVQAAPPDTLYLNAVGGFVSSKLGLTDESRAVRPGVRRSRAVEPIAAEPALARNVLFVITESTRADATCPKYQPNCVATPYTNELLPRRHALSQLRALDSTTAITLPVLLAGVGPHESSEVMHEWPLLFDYARAAGWFTAYWTSQNLFFANSHSFVQDLGVDLFVSGTQLDGRADLDMGADEALLAAHVQRDVSKLREPFFAVLHTSNVHYPYLVDERRAQPFQPAKLSKEAEDADLLFNHYRNAVLQHDRHVADAIASLRRTEMGQRTVIIYTSDHGEAFREHGQLGHTFSMFDEEVKVPGFIDAPEGTLTDHERAQLVAHEQEFTFHPDLMVTALDLMGLWGHAALAPFESKILGRSLIRKPRSPRILPMTNCASIWSCAFENWGVMRGELKLFARTPFERGWQCFDLREDPLERQPLDNPQCDALRQEALTQFGRPPR